MQPSTFEAWPARDRGLAEALIEYEGSFCEGCGQPKDSAWDPESDGSFEVHEFTCSGCKAMAVHEKETTGEPEPGEKTYVSLNEKDYKIAKARAAKRAAKSGEPSP